MFKVELAAENSLVVHSADGHVVARCCDCTVDGPARSLDFVRPVTVAEVMGVADVVAAWKAE